MQESVVDTKPLVTDEINEDLFRTISLPPHKGTVHVLSRKKNQYSDLVDGFIIEIPLADNEVGSIIVRFKDNSDNAIYALHETLFALYDLPEGTLVVPHYLDVILQAASKNSPAISVYSDDWIPKDLIEKHSITKEEKPLLASPPEVRVFEIATNHSSQFGINYKELSPNDIANSQALFQKSKKLFWIVSTTPNIQNDHLEEILEEGLAVDLDMVLKESDQSAFEPTFHKKLMHFQMPIFDVDPENSDKIQINPTNLLVNASVVLCTQNPKSRFLQETLSDLSQNEMNCMNVAGAGSLACYLIEEGIKYNKKTLQKIIDEMTALRSDSEKDKISEEDFTRQLNKLNESLKMITKYMDPVSDVLEKLLNLYDINTSLFLDQDPSDVIDTVQARHKTFMETVKACEQDLQEIEIQFHSALDNKTKEKNSVVIDLAVITASLVVPEIFIEFMEKFDLIQKSVSLEQFTFLATLALFGLALYYRFHHRRKLA
jgi:Mg2+ and Co2+ transporter CorA